MWRKRAKNLFINWLTLFLAPVWMPLAFLVILFGSIYTYIKEGRDIEDLDDVERDFMDFWILGDVILWSNSRDRSIREVAKRFNNSVEKMKAP